MSSPAPLLPFLVQQKRKPKTGHARQPLDAAAAKKDIRQKIVAWVGCAPAFGVLYTLAKARVASSSFWLQLLRAIGASMGAAAAERKAA